jgi:hypothetical protein
MAMVTERTKIYGEVRPESPAGELSPPQFVAIGLLLAGRPYADVAREVGIDNVTLFRWRQEPAFVAELRAQFELMHAAARYGLFSLATDAVSALRSSLKGQNEAARVSAAQIVLDRLDVGRGRHAGEGEAQADAEGSLLDAEINARARHLLQDEFRGLDDAQIIARVRALLGESAK